MIFDDRRDAGKKLQERLKDFDDTANTIVIGLPRGGVVVADEVARGLNLPLDVIIAKKLGAPKNPELAIGAIADGVRVIDELVIKEYRVSTDYVERETLRQTEEIERREKLYRRGFPVFDLHGKTVILVDDGIATGATMRAAVKFAKTRKAQEIVVAVPAASKDTADELRKEVDRVECLESTGPYFFAVGQHYAHFPQVSDEEVIEILKASRERAKQ